jgi:hypothetical protein
MSQFEVIAIVAASFIIHNVAFILLRSSHPKSIEARSRFVSTFHAIVSSASFIITIAVFAETLPWSPAALILGQQLPQNLVRIIACILAYTIGYFVSDTLIMMRFKEVYSLDALVHHLLILSCVSFGLASKNCFV